MVASCHDERLVLCSCSKLEEADMSSNIIWYSLETRKSSPKRATKSRISRCNERFFPATHRLDVCDLFTKMKISCDFIEHKCTFCENKRQCRNLILKKKLDNASCKVHRLTKNYVRYRSSSQNAQNRTLENNKRNNTWFARIKRSRVLQ
jgi:hypothetical protein